MEKDTANTELIRGHVDTIILGTLLEKDGYPYDILREIEEKSAGNYILKQATLYSSMKRLEKLGYINSYWGTESEGGRRRYYSLTDAGKEFLERDKAEWEYSRTLINKLLSDKEVDLEKVTPPFDASALRPLTKRTAATGENTDLDDKFAPQTNASEIDGKNSDENIENATDFGDNNSENMEISVDFGNKNAENIDIPAASRNKNTENGENSADNIYYVRTPIFQHNLPDDDQNKGFSGTEHREIAADTAVQQAEKPTFASLLEAETVETEDMRAAANALFSGEYNENRYKNSHIESDAVAQPSVDAMPKQEKPTVGNYREVLNKMFAADNVAKPLKNEEKPNESDENLTFALQPKGRHIKDLQENLAKQGYTLKLYSQKNRSDYYYNKYIYQNKLNFATNIIVFIVMMLQFVLVAALNGLIHFAPLTLVLSGIAIAAVPAFFALVFLVNPSKRIRANYNFVQTILYRFILALIIIAITVIVCLVTPSLGIDFNDPRMYLPWMFALDIPLYAIIYNILYRSKRFHLTCPKF